MALTMRSLVLACALLVHPLSRADAVADWNKIALGTVVLSDQSLESKLHTMAIVHVAMFEALNFVQGRYHPHFIVNSPKLDGMSIDAVAAAAARHVLLDLYPNQEAALAALPGHLATPGDVLGTSIAAVICAVRALPGLEPWLFTSAQQFRPKGGVAQRGGLRTRDDSDVRASSIHFGTSPLRWNSMAAELIAARGLSPIEGARIHALVSMVIADAYAAARDAQYPCAPCIAAPAVVTILESELGASLALISERSVKTDQELGREIGQYALRHYFRPLH